MRVPLDDAVIGAVSRLFDDRESTREPSHYQLGVHIKAVGLGDMDPPRSNPMGKSKRIRAVLNAALEHEEEAGGELVTRLIGELRSAGGFREESQNFVGSESIDNAKAAFAGVGVQLAGDGDLRLAVLESLAGSDANDALMSYVRRARRGWEDSALVVGTGKDLLEATAAHVLLELYSAYNEHLPFAALLGQAFAALNLATPQSPAQPQESPQRAIERALYDLGCGVNRLRNKQGTGHGRPFLPELGPDEARTAIEALGLIAEHLLNSLRIRR
jgi:hypothetical protein